MIGQSFEIEVARETSGWLIGSPRSAGFTRVQPQGHGRLAAQEYIATRTGIPIGYVAIFVAREAVSAE